MSGWRLIEFGLFLTSLICGIAIGQLRFHSPPDPAGPGESRQTIYIAFPVYLPSQTQTRARPWPSAALQSPLQNARRFIPDEPNPPIFQGALQCAASKPWPSIEKTAP